MLANFGKTISKKTENLQQNRNTYSQKIHKMAKILPPKKKNNNNNKPKREDVVCKSCVID